MGDVGLARSAARKRFSAELRQVRNAASLSLRELEQHTHASDSSLFRYLSGQSLPPWPVVEALCQLADRDPVSLKPLWDAAKDGHPLKEGPTAYAESLPERPPGAGPGTASPEWERAGDRVDPGAGPAVTGPGRRRWRTLLILAMGMAAGSAVQPLAGYVVGLLPRHSAAISWPYVSVELFATEGGTGLNRDSELCTVIPAWSTCTAGLSSRCCKVVKATSVPIVIAMWPCRAVNPAVQ
jgi:hypothetical protein